MDRRTGLMPAGTHPKLIRGNTPYLRDQQMRRDPLMQPPDRHDRFIAMLTRHKIFALQLLAAAGRKTHLEMRQSLMPGPRYAHLRRTVLGRQVPDRMDVLRGSLTSMEIGLPGKVTRLPRPALDPHLIDIF